jgi:biotin transport system substrate-specific component
MAIQVRRPTLADTFRMEGNAALVRDVLLVLVFGSLMGLFARISIPLPFTPVPITGQTFGVLLIGAVLGSRRGAAAMLVYLAEGIAGLPVFALGLGGWAVISGPTGGYLLSYPLAAFVVGFLAGRGWDRSIVFSAIAMLAGEIIIYAIGVPWLGHFVGMSNAVSLGLTPFIGGDLFKLVLAAAILPSAWLLVNRTNTTDLMGGLRR